MWGNGGGSPHACLGALTVLDVDGGDREDREEHHQRAGQHPVPKQLDVELAPGPGRWGGLALPVQRQRLAATR